MDLEGLILKAQERVERCRVSAAYNRRRAEEYDLEAAEFQQELDALLALREGPRLVDPVKERKTG
jgi:hypothetical protein